MFVLPPPDLRWAPAAHWSLRVSRAGSSASRLCCTRRVCRPLVSGTSRTVRSCPRRRISLKLTRQVNARIQGTWCLIILLHCTYNHIDLVWPPWKSTMKLTPFIATLSVGQSVSAGSPDHEHHTPQSHEASSSRCSLTLFLKYAGREGCTRVWGCSYPLKEHAGISLSYSLFTTVHVHFILILTIFLSVLPCFMFLNVFFQPSREPSFPVVSLCVKINLFYMQHK